MKQRVEGIKYLSGKASPGELSSPFSVEAFMSRGCGWALGPREISAAPFGFSPSRFSALAALLDTPPGEQALRIAMDFSPFRMSYVSPHENISPDLFSVVTDLEGAPSIYSLAILHNLWQRREEWFPVRDPSTRRTVLEEFCRSSSMTGLLGILTRDEWQRLGVGTAGHSERVQRSTGFRIQRGKEHERTRISDAGLPLGSAGRDALVPLGREE